MHPRRWWVKTFRSSDLERLIGAHLPPPIDLLSDIIKLRTGHTNSSPSKCHKPKPHVEPKLIAALSYNANHPERAKAQRLLAGSKLVTGGEALALYGAGLIEKLSAIDFYVYHATSNLSGDNIDSLSSLSRAFEGWKHNDWSGLHAGGVDKFAGHLGEVLSAQHLEQAGTHVVWPQLSNEPGWDLLVNGHAVNIKTVADSSNLADHFARYPNIAVVVPGDSQHLPFDAFHFHGGGDAGNLLGFLDGHHDHSVIVDHALSNSEVLTQATDASDIALGAASIVELHIPWITLGLSGFREFELLRTNHTDYSSATKNIAADVGGRAGGAYVGAKAGALAFGLFGPIPAVVGAVLGAVAGGLMGNEIAGELKSRGVKDAQVRLNNTVLTFQELAKAENAKAKERFDRRLIIEQEALDKIAEGERSKINTSKAAVETWYQESNSLAPPVVLLGIEQAIAELQKYQCEVDKKQKQQTLKNKYFWPTLNTISLEMATATMDSWSAWLRSLREHVLNDKPISRGIVLSQLAACGVAKEFIKVSIVTHESRREQLEKNYRHCIDQAMENLIEARASASDRLNKLASAIVTDVREAMSIPLEAVQLAINSLRQERVKLGQDS